MPSIKPETEVGVYVVILDARYYRIMKDSIGTTLCGPKIGVSTRIEGHAQRSKMSGGHSPE